MNKLTKTSIMCAVLVSGLAACESVKKENEVTVEAPTPKHTASLEHATNVKPAEGSLSYHEKSKHHKYYISTNSASYVDDIDSINGTSTFMNVSVRLENTFEEGESVSLKDLHFTLEDVTDSKTYEPATREAYTKEGYTLLTTNYPNMKLEDKPLDLNIVFNIPDKPDHLYQLMVVQDEADADYFYLDTIKSAYK